MPQQSRLLDEIQETVRGLLAAGVIDKRRMERLDALLETMEILADKDLMSQIEHSKRDIEQGRLVDMDEAFDVRC